MTSAATSTPSNDQPQPAVRPVMRSGTDRMIGGVCGGLAEYTGIDAALWRAAAVLVTVFGGAGIPIYLLLWVLLPSSPLPDGTRPSALEQGIQRLRAAVLGHRARDVS